MLISDGQRILSCGADHFMRVLDVHTGTEVYSKNVGEEIRYGDRIRTNQFCNIFEIIPIDINQYCTQI